MHRKKNNLSVIECAGIYRTNDIQMKKRAKKAQRQQKLNNIIHIFKLGKLHMNISEMLKTVLTVIVISLLSLLCARSWFKYFISFYDCKVDDFLTYRIQMINHSLYNSKYVVVIDKKTIYILNAEKDDWIKVARIKFNQKVKIYNNYYKDQEVTELVKIIKNVLEEFH